jgi:drug/metabolite transporter, DME family
MPLPKEASTRGFFLLITAAVLWGLIGPVSKYIFSQGMPPLESAFWRGALAGFCFFIHWLFIRYPLPRSSKDWLGIFLFSIFGVALLEGSFVLAVEHAGAALASILLYSAPIWVNLVSLVLFREEIPVRRWFALALTLAGVIGVCALGGEAKFSLKAIFWGLMSGLSYAGFYISGKIFFRRLHPVTVYMIAFPVASFVLLPIISVSSQKAGLGFLTSLTDYPPGVIAACVFVGIFATYLPYLLYGAGLRLVDISRASIITTVEPVIAVITASIVWGERFSIVGYIFMVAVLIGVALS